MAVSQSCQSSGLMVPSGFSAGFMAEKLRQQSHEGVLSLPCRPRILSKLKGPLLGLTGIVGRICKTTLARHL